MATPTTHIPMQGGNPPPYSQIDTSTTYGGLRQVMTSRNRPAYRPRRNIHAPCTNTTERDLDEIRDLTCIPQLTEHAHGPAIHLSGDGPNFESLRGHPADINQAIQVDQDPVISASTLDLPSTVDFFGWDDPLDIVPPDGQVGDQVRGICESVVAAFCRFPLQVYLQLLFRLPAIYQARISRTFRQSVSTVEDVHDLVVATSKYKRDHREALARYSRGLSFTFPAPLPPTAQRFEQSWAALMESLMEEWKILNFGSILVILTSVAILQIDTVTTEPVARTSALLSLISASMGLSYGCAYTLKFSGLRCGRIAAEWAESSMEQEPVRYWDTWVLLSLPAVWLAWAVIFYVVCLMAFVWRTGLSADDAGVFVASPTPALALRLTVTGVLVLGMMYLYLVIDTMRSYGAGLDKKWNQIIEEGLRYLEITLHLGTFNTPPRRDDSPTTRLKPAYPRPGANARIPERDGGVVAFRPANDPSPSEAAPHRRADLKMPARRPPSRTPGSSNEGSRGIPNRSAIYDLPMKPPQSSALSSAVHTLRTWDVAHLPPSARLPHPKAPPVVMVPPPPAPVYDFSPRYGRPPIIVEKMGRASSAAGHTYQPDGPALLQTRSL